MVSDIGACAYIWNHYFFGLKKGKVSHIGAWEYGKQQYFDILERIQRRAAKLVNGEYRRGPEVSVNQIIPDFIGWGSPQIPLH